MLIIGDVICFFHGGRGVFDSIISNKQKTVRCSPTDGIDLTALKLFGAYATDRGPRFRRWATKRVWWWFLPSNFPKKCLEMMNPFKGNPISRWRFQICSNIFKNCYPDPWKDDPIWQICFKWVAQPPTRFLFFSAMSAALNWGMVEKIEKQDMEKEVKIINHSHPRVVSWLTKRSGKNDLQLTLERTLGTPAKYFCQCFCWF